MYAHLREGAPLPPSQVVHTTPRGPGAPPITAATCRRLPPRRPRCADHLQRGRKIRISQQPHAPHPGACGTASAPPPLARSAAEGHLWAKAYVRTRRGFGASRRSTMATTTLHHFSPELLPASSSGSFGSAYRPGAGGAPSATSAATSCSAAASSPTASNATSSAASSSAAGPRRRPPSAADASRRRAGSGGRRNAPAGLPPERAVARSRAASVSKTSSAGKVPSPPPAPHALVVIL